MASSTAFDRKSPATLSIFLDSSGVAFAAARSLISALTSPSTCDFTDSCWAARRASSTANLSSAIYLPQMENTHAIAGGSSGDGENFVLAERVGFEPTERFP